MGALLDGIPESVVLGLVAGGAVRPVVLAAVFISKVPEGLSSTAGMKKSGRSAGYVFGAQLRRFIGGRSGNKVRYAPLLVDALPAGQAPPPLAGLIDSLSP